MKIIINALGFDEGKALIFITYLALINGFGFIAMGLDKYYAKKQRWRISEKNFFITAALGGAMGILWAMKLFRHKTLHKSFSQGIPVLVILNIATLVVIYYSKVF